MCEVVRRGRFLVADPFLEPGAPISLGRRGSLPVEAGELVAVEVNAGRGRVVERLGRPNDIRALMRAVLIEGGVGTPYPERRRSPRRTPPRPSPTGSTRAASICAT